MPGEISVIMYWIFVHLVIFVHLAAVMSSHGMILSVGSSIDAHDYGSVMTNK